MEIRLIGNNGCSRCEIVKNILVTKGIDFTYVMLNDMSQEEQDNVLLMARKKGMLNLPLIIKNDTLITLEEV